MGIIVRAAHLAQFPLGHQLSRGRGTGPDQLLGGIAPKAVGMLGDIQLNTVHLDLLGDIGRDQVIIETLFLQTLIVPPCRFICQIQGPSDISPNYLVIRVKGKEPMMKGFDMVTGLHGHIVPAQSGHRLQYLSTGKDIDRPLYLAYHAIAHVDRKSRDQNAGRDQKKAKALDVLEGRIDILQL